MKNQHEPRGTGQRDLPGRAYQRKSEILGEGGV